MSHFRSSSPRREALNRTIRYKPSASPHIRGPRSLRVSAVSSTELLRVVGIVAPDGWSTTTFLETLLRGRPAEHIDIDASDRQFNLAERVRSELGDQSVDRTADIIIRNVRSSTMSDLGSMILDLVDSRRNVNFVLISTERGIFDELASTIASARIVSLRELLMTPLTANELIRKLSGRQPERVVSSPMPPPVVAYIGNKLADTAIDGRVPGDLLQQMISDFIVHEVKSADRRQLARLSIPDELDEALAVRLVGKGAPRILDDLTRLGLADWIPSSRRFILEGPVRSALRWMIKERHGEIEDANKLVALWALDSEQPLAAIRHGVESGDFYLVSRILRTYWIELVDSPAPTAARLLSVPDDVQARFPLIPMTIALSLCAQGQTEAATHPWRIAAQSAKNMKPADDPVETFWGSAIQAVALSRLGQHSGAARAAWESYSTFQRLSARRVREQPASAFHMLVELALAMVAVDDFERAAEILDYIATAIPIQNTRILAKVREIQSWMAAVDGDIPNARRLLTWAERNSDCGPTFFGHLSRALVATEAAEFVRALEAVDRALEDSGHTQLHGFATATRALAEGYRGRPLIGLSEVAKGRRSTIKQGIAATEATTRAEVVLLLMVGRTQAAFDVAQTLRRKVVLNACIVAASEIASGRHDHALYRLSTYRLGGEIGVQPRGLANAMVLASVAAYRSGQNGSARRFAEEAASVLETFTMQAPLAFVPIDDSDYMLASQLRFNAVGFERILHAQQPLRLSKREMTLLRTMPLVDSRESLANELGVSVNTVKTQLRDIYRKLHTSGWSETLYKAADLGLLSAEDVA